MGDEGINKDPRPGPTSSCRTRRQRLIGREDPTSEATPFPLRFELRGHGSGVSHSNTGTERPSLVETTVRIKGVHPASPPAHQGHRYGKVIRSAVVATCPWHASICSACTAPSKAGHDRKLPLNPVHSLPTLVHLAHAGLVQPLLNSSLSPTGNCQCLCGIVSEAQLNNGCPNCLVGSCLGESAA
jgi:hypothetical protein